MLTIRGLKKRYKDFQVLNGLDMNINKGDVYGFIGKNGCGKTTTMNIICNVIPKDGGEVKINGGEKCTVGYLPETPELYGYMSGEEYLSFIAACADYKGNVRERTRDVLKAVGLSEVGGRRVKGYSRGMNQRLGIGAAIYGNPDLLILDEPTSALDPEGRAEVVRIINRLAEAGTTILLCTHILTDVERVANRIGVLSGGVMAAEGTIDEILDKHIKDIAISVKVIGDNPDQLKALRKAPLVLDSVAYPAKKTATLFTSSRTSVEEFSFALMGFAAENKIPLESFRVERPNLEQVYFSIVEDAKLNRREEL